MTTKDQIDTRIAAITDQLIELDQQKVNINNRIRIYHEELVGLELKLIELSVR